jgi:hypothetical protein
MTARTDQPSLFPERPQTPSRPRHSHVATVRTPSGVVYDFHDWTDLGPPLPFETIPPEIRFPHEPGYVELDRFMLPSCEQRASGTMRVKGGAG